MERLNLNHLYYFYVTAKEGSITRASSKLHVTPPTISDQIKLLEEFFETKLFQKIGRSLTLTEKGNIALEYAESIFSQSLEVTQILKHKSRVPRKTLDIGITDYMSHYFLYDLLMPLIKNSEVATNFKEDERKYLVADLENGDKDIVLTYSKDSIPSTIASYRIGVNKTYVIAHKKYRKYKKDFPQSLTNIPFVNYTQDSFLRYEIDHYFSKNEVAPRQIGECDDIEFHELIAKNEIGFVIVPEIAKKRICKDKNIISLGEIKEFQTSIWALMRKDNKSIAKDFIKTIEI